MRRTRHPVVTDRLLACGAVAGPLFTLTVAAQDAIRPGIDPRRHPLSLLSTGDLGWLQIANFVLAGALNVGYAAGLWRALPSGHGARTGAGCVAAYGVGLVVAGAFVTDPAAGYPPGVPAPPEPSLHGQVHAAGTVLAVGSLIAACAAFARWFAVRQKLAWSVYCGLTGLVLLAVAVALAMDDRQDSLLLRLAAPLGWGWAALLAYRLRSLRYRRSSAGRYTAAGMCSGTASRCRPRSDCRCPCSGRSAARH